MCSFKYIFWTHWATRGIICACRIKLNSRPSAKTRITSRAGGGTGGINERIRGLGWRVEEVVGGEWSEMGVTWRLFWSIVCGKKYIRAREEEGNRPPSQEATIDVRLPCAPPPHSSSLWSSCSHFQGYPSPRAVTSKTGWDWAGMLVAKFMNELCGRCVFLPGHLGALSPLPRELEAHQLYRRNLSLVPAGHSSGNASRHLQDCGQEWEWCLIWALHLYDDQSCQLLR